MKGENEKKKKSVKRSEVGERESVKERRMEREGKSRVEEYEW